VPRGNPSIGLIPSLTDSELKFECIWIWVGDGASLQISLGVLGGGSVSEEKPLVNSIWFASKISSEMVSPSSSLGESIGTVATDTSFDGVSEKS
jgi:hypothetical protein